MNNRPYIQRPTLRRDEEIASIERQIWRDIERLIKISTPIRMTFLMNNIRTRLKNEGVWMDRVGGADDNRHGDGE